QRTMNTYLMRSRSMTRCRPRAFRPDVLGLEQRTMMASGLAPATAQVARPTAVDEKSIFVGEMTTLLSEQPLRAPFVAQLNQALHNGSLTREGVTLQILRTPQAQAGIVKGLTEYLLDREATPAETKALVGVMQTRGTDVPWVFFQIMRRPEFFRDSGGTNTA